MTSVEDQVMMSVEALPGGEEMTPVGSRMTSVEDPADVTRVQNDANRETVQGGKILPGFGFQTAKMASLPRRVVCVAEAWPSYSGASAAQKGFIRERQFGRVFDDRL